MHERQEEPGWEEGQAPGGEPEPEEGAERRFPFNYTDVAETIGTSVLAGLILTETVDSGFGNLMFAAAGTMLVIDIMRRRSAGNYGPSS